MICQTLIDLLHVQQCGWQEALLQQSNHYLYTKYGCSAAGVLPAAGMCFVFVDVQAAGSTPETMCMNIGRSVSGVLPAACTSTKNKTHTCSRPLFVYKLLNKEEVREDLAYQEVYTQPFCPSIWLLCQHGMAVSCGFQATLLLVVQRIACLSCAHL